MIPSGMEKKRICDKESVKDIFTEGNKQYNSQEVTYGKHKGTY